MTDTNANMLMNKIKIEQPIDLALKDSELRKAGIEQMEQVLISIAEKRSWPWRTQVGTLSPENLYLMLPEGDNEEQIDRIVASSKPTGIRLPPSVAAPAAAPSPVMPVMGSEPSSVAPTAAAPSPAEPRPLYRDLSAAPSPVMPVTGSKPSLVAPPAAALSPLRVGSQPSSPAYSAYSPLYESIRSSTQNTPLKNRNPLDVLEHISEFLKGAVELRKHCQRSRMYRI